MAKDDRFDFEGFLVHKDLETRVREFGENRKREVAAAYARLKGSKMAAAQHAAYEAALPDLLALPAGEVRWPSHDPRLLLDEALDCAEAVVERRTELEARVGHKFQVPLMLLLERYALATMHAFKGHRANPAPPDSLPQLVELGARRRQRLAAGCDLAFSEKPHLYALLRDIDGSMMPEAIAYDIFLLRRTLIATGPETGGGGLANYQELAHAERLAATLLQAVNNPNSREALAWAPADMYARAYTLLHRAYYEAELGLTELEAGSDGPHPPLCNFCDAQVTTVFSLHKF